VLGVLLAAALVVLLAAGSWADKPICRADERQFGEEACFHLTAYSYSWATAQDKCRERGMELASIHSQKEQDFLFGAADEAHPEHDTWIGLKHIDGERSYALRHIDEEGFFAWEWSDGTEYDWNSFAWEKEQPDDYKKPDICVYLHHLHSDDNISGKWYDHDCTRLRRAACKRTPRCGKGEHLYDGNTCFWFETEKLSWYAAQAKCKERGDGWELASIRSQAENDFFKDLPFGGGSKMWIGLKKRGDGGTARDYTWSDGTPMDYRSLMLIQNTSRRLRCFVMNESAERFVSTPCVTYRKSVCRGPHDPIA